MHVLLDGSPSHTMGGAPVVPVVPVLAPVDAPVDPVLAPVDAPVDPVLAPVVPVVALVRAKHRKITRARAGSEFDFMSIREHSI